MKETLNLYESKEYLDYYGIDLLISIILIFILVFANVYYYIKNNLNSMKKDWDKNQCNPLIMPFAGLIHSKKGLTASQYTQQNFEKCLSDNVRPFTKLSLKPFKKMGSVLASDFQSLGTSITKLEKKTKKEKKKAEKEKISVSQNAKNKMNSLYISIDKFRDISSQITAVTQLLTYESLSVMATIQSMISTLVKMIRKDVPFGKEILNQK